jgi:hypothetical protein
LVEWQTINTHVDPNKNHAHVEEVARVAAVPVERTGRSRSRRFMNFGISFSGYWCGPYTLLPRVMMRGRLKELL